jgi:hypothetical protein
MWFNHSDSETLETLGEGEEARVDGGSDFVDFEGDAEHLAADEVGDVDVLGYWGRHGVVEVVVEVLVVIDVV